MRALHPTLRDGLLVGLLLTNVVLCSLVLLRLDDRPACFEGTADTTMRRAGSVGGLAPMPPSTYNNETIADIMAYLDTSVDEHQYAARIKWAIRERRAMGRAPSDELLTRSVSAIGHHLLRRLIQAGAAQAARLDTILELMRTPHAPSPDGAGV
jgi:hypothetical protein